LAAAEVAAMAQTETAVTDVLPLTPEALAAMLLEEAAVVRKHTAMLPARAAAVSALSLTRS